MSDPYMQVVLELYSSETQNTTPYWVSHRADCRTDRAELRSHFSRIGDRPGQPATTHARRQLSCSAAMVSRSSSAAIARRRPLVRDLLGLHATQTSRRQTRRERVGGGLAVSRPDIVVVQRWTAGGGEGGAIGVEQLTLVRSAIIDGQSEYQGIGDIAHRMAAPDHLPIEQSSLPIAEVDIARVGVTVEHRVRRRVDLRASRRRSFRRYRRLSPPVSSNPFQPCGAATIA